MHLNSDHRPRCHRGRALTIERAREQWSPAGLYLNTASYGLPPRDGFDAMQAALADWVGTPEDDDVRRP